MELQNLIESGFKPNLDRFNQIQNNAFFEEEYEILVGSPHYYQGVEYYLHIIEHVEIKDNSKNSYLLWVCDKVESIDLKKPTEFNHGRYALPDIDVDFPPDWREKVIQYLKEKYGGNKVCQMLTFGRLAGRSIIKEVLRVNEACSFEEMNEITKKIPNQADISDLLEEMENPSVIRWALENDRDALSDYCYLDDDGKLSGDHAKVFDQAMRMEGIFKTQGKHAAGVVIASDPLDEVCPMVKASRNNDKIAGLEMGDLEAIGCVKFDILGVSILKKISETVEEINNE